jgi:hypothetical protein
VKPARPYICLLIILVFYGVDSLGAAVVVRHRERGGGGLDVQAEAAGE